MRPTVLVQLSDPHVHFGETGRRDPSKRLAAAVRSVLDLQFRPDAVIVTGDLVNTPLAEEYARTREILAELPMPLHVLPGNHDSPGMMREFFPFPDGTEGVGRYRYTARVGGLRLIVCDTTIPGAEGGQFDEENRGWLEGLLSVEREVPTIVAMHHPPLRTGIRALDEICLAAGDRAELATLLAAAPQVRRVISGHVHRAAFYVLEGCGIFTCPSTWLEASLKLAGDDLDLIDEPPAYAVHALLGDELTSHVQPVVAPADGLNTTASNPT